MSEGPEAGASARPEPRFVADVHLGKLARLLRMLGFDVLWWADAPHSDDAYLAERSRTEHRVLLTRDRALWESAEPQLRHYVQATDPEEQLVEVLRAVGLAPGAAGLEDLLSRCLDCNALIEEVGRDEARGRVPDEVFERQPRFFRCPDCRKLFWEGSHFDRMKERGERLLKRAGN